jgi:hypothetical protein
MNNQPSGRRSCLTYLLCCAFWCLPAAVQAQDDPPDVPAAPALPAAQPPPARTAAKRAPIALTVAKPSSPIELMEGWKLSVTVENVSDDVVHLHDLRWVVPPQLVSTRPMNADPKSAWDTKDYNEGQTKELGAGQIRTIQFEMPSVSAGGGTWFLTPSILSWKYRQLPITVQVSYTSGDDAVAGSVSETIEVQWQTPFRTMAFGGFLGALLAMAFYYLYLRLSVVTSYFKERKFPTSVDNPEEAGKARQQILDGLKVALRLTQCSPPASLSLSCSCCWRAGTKRCCRSASL